MNAPAVTVWLVGAGPGGVDLLTVKAARLIASADWILYDALVSDEILALAPQASKIDVGKRAGSAEKAAKQTDINQQLVSIGLLAYAQGKTVVRLKGGDPLIFARAEEEITALDQAGLSFAIVPGITAAQAAHASIKQPLTRRGIQRSFVLTTPQVQNGDSIGTQWARPLVAAGAGAIYMAASATTRIKGTLLALGLPAATPTCWVLNAGSEQARIFTQTLGDLRFPELQSAPALLLIGSTPWTSPSSIGNTFSTFSALQQPGLSSASLLV